MRRHFLLGCGILIITGAAWLARAQVAAPTSAPAEEMRELAERFYESLDPAQRAAVRMEFGDDERQNWHFTPVARKGLAWKEMTPPQRELGRALVRSGLSTQGYEKVEAIQQLEETLGQIESSTTRDPQNYYISLFGKAGSTEPWGWRFEGHHIALNFTIAGDGVATAPAFLGVNPAKVPDGPRKDLRILAREEDLGRALIKALDADQQKIAIIAATAPREIITSNSRRISPAAPAGIAAGRMSESQRKMLMELIGEYANRMRAELKEQDLARIDAAGVEKVHFAWAGGTEPGAPHYYRIQGPTFLIEYDDTQNNANHIHSVWRDPMNDFGEDLLRRHYAAGGHETTH